MSEFTIAAKVDELPDGEKLLVEVEERLVILFRVGDDYYCIDDICTHDGGTLSDGDHEGCQIECPRHGARFDVRTGEALTMPATESTFTHKVKVDAGNILVKLNEQLD
ncbi:MAG: non-heme iron oxygenase ferredoxin subunit [Planctomycetota bacterium]